MKKMMKRLLSSVLMAAMIMTMTIFLAVPAFAANTAMDASVSNTIYFYNEYDVLNSGSSSPEETFTYTIVPYSVTDAGLGITVDTMPKATIGSVKFSKGDAGSATKKRQVAITLPAYTSVGIYTYKITQNKGTSAGVEYFTGDMYLVASVEQTATGKTVTAAIHCESPVNPVYNSVSQLAGVLKTDMLSNNFQSGDIVISKTVTGNFGDREKYFKVSVKLDGESGKTYESSYPVTGGSYSGNPTTVKVGEVTTFMIKHDETITLKNIPYGVTYQITEASYDSEGYSATYDKSDAGTGLVDSTNEYVKITNFKAKLVDTGVDTNVLPYVMAFGCIVLMFAGFMILRTKRNGRAGR